MFLSKNYSLFSMLILSLVLSVAACKKDNGPAVEEIDLFLIAGKDSTLTVETVKGGYSVLSDNEVTAVATLQGVNVHISGKKVGTAVIKIKDAQNKERTIIRVTVQRGYNLLKILRYKMSVQVANAAIKEQISAELNQDLPAPAGALYGIRDSGGLYFFPAGLEGERTEGTFTFDNSTRMLVLKYNGKMFSYIFGSYGTKGASVSESPVLYTDYYLRENLTEKYKTLYPAAGVTEVIRDQVLNPER